MARKINYRPITQNLDTMVKPSSPGRVSLGMEGHVGEYYYIAVDKLFPYKQQARRFFNEKDIENLCESIKKHGIRQPLTVCKVSGEDKYEVISGERRLRAAVKAGLKKVPCIVLNNEDRLQEIALIENIHRANLHPFELGEAYLKLIDTEYFCSQAEIVKGLSVSKQHVSAHIAYTKLPDKIKNYVVNKDLRSRDTYRKLLKHSDDIEKLEEILGINKQTRNNKFSVFRVFFDNGNFILQGKGFGRLSLENKRSLKNKLLKVINEL
jgi:ParB family transcriptional regulator, chromosome partitioning protein